MENPLLANSRRTLTRNQRLHRPQPILRPYPRPISPLCPQPTPRDSQRNRPRTLYPRTNSSPLSHRIPRQNAPQQRSRPRRRRFHSPPKARRFSRRQITHRRLHDPQRCPIRRHPQSQTPRRQFARPCRVFSQSRPRRKIALPPPLHTPQRARKLRRVLWSVSR